MMQFLDRHVRDILLFDAATCLTFALACLGLPGLIAALFAIPPGWSFPAGMICLGFGVFLAALGARAEPAPGAVLFAGMGNVGWALASFASVGFGFLTPNTLGVVFVVAQGAIVLLLGEAQVLAALARLRAARAA